jgi:TRAP-type C4-dicarboxylate transport system substrate-binding protein
MAGKWAIAAAVAAVLTATAGQAAELRFAFPAPPRSLINLWGFEPWAKDVAEASKGTLDIKIVGGPTLGTFGNIYDRTTMGVTDISFGVFSAMGTRFPRAEVSSVPFEIENPMEGAVALWRLYVSGALKDEFGDTRVLSLFVFGNPAIHTRAKEIKAVSDLRGMKIGVGGKLYSDILAVLDVAPLASEPPDLYQGISRGMYEGAMIQWTAVSTFKLYEVTKYHYEVPLGAAGAFVVMNKASYDKLPPPAKAAIDRYSGEPFARRMGDVMTRMDTATRAEVRKIEGQTFNSISAEDRKSWSDRLHPVIEEWTKRTPDGQAVLTALRSELAKIRASR